MCIPVAISFHYPADVKLNLVWSGFARLNSTSYAITKLNHLTFNAYILD